MRALLTRLISLLFILAACFFALGNRRPVQISLDLLFAPAPWLVFEIPLFIALFFAFLFGLLAGGLTRFSFLRRRTRR